MRGSSESHKCPALWLLLTNEPVLQYCGAKQAVCILTVDHQLTDEHNGLSREIVFVDKSQPVISPPGYTCWSLRPEQYFFPVKHPYGCCQRHDCIQAS